MCTPQALRYRFWKNEKSEKIQKSEKRTKYISKK